MKTRHFCKACLGYTILFLTFFGLNNTCNAQYPSDSAKIYMITVSPGEEIYSCFGHSAIRVSDSRYGVDMTYGYGTFDFTTPYFYEKFVYGRLLYCLSEDRFDDFMSEYKSTGQEVYQQSLNLTNQEKYKLILNLQNNYRPENRWYRYDFLYDNCATRIRDIIEKSVEGRVLYDSAFAKNKVSFRELLMKSLENSPWVSLGINTMLGIGSDKVAPVKDYMFLPTYLMQIFPNAIIVSGHSDHPLAGKPYLLLKGTLQTERPNIFNSPEIYFIIFVVISILASFWGTHKKIHANWFDVFLFSITGLVGLIFLSIWIGSLHKVMACNINILWANPLNLIIVFMALFSANRLKRSGYLIVLFAGMFILYFPISIITSHHLFLVPVLFDFLLLTRLWVIVKD